MNEETLDKALTEIHRRARLAYRRTGIEALRQITEFAWAAIAYGRAPGDDGASAADVDLDAFEEALALVLEDSDGEPYRVLATQGPAVLRLVDTLIESVERTDGALADARERFAKELLRVPDFPGDDDFSYGVRCGMSRAVAFLRGLHESQRPR